MVGSKVNKWMFFCVIFLALFLTACPYESEVPLENPLKAKIDVLLLGQWGPAEKKDRESGVITIYAYNNHGHVLVVEDPGGKNLTVMRAISTRIGKEKFLSVQELNTTAPLDRKWIFAKYTISGDKLKYRVVDEKLFTGKYPSSSSLCAFIRNNINNPRLFGDNQTEVLRRVYPHAKSELPPLELLKSNYKQASFVVTIVLSGLETEKIVRADNGSIGYIVTKESGTVLKSFKGNLREGTTITYHDWLEHRPGWKYSRRGILLVFLKKDPKTGALRTIGEASVFRMTSELNKAMPQLTRSL